MKTIPCRLKYVPVYRRGGPLQMLLLLIEITPLNGAHGEYWTHLEREGSGIGISSTTFDGYTNEGEQYVQCVGQFLVLEEIPLLEYSFEFLLERHWRVNGKNLRRRIASLKCSISLAADGRLSSLSASAAHNLSITTTRV